MGKVFKFIADPLDLFGKRKKAKAKKKAKKEERKEKREDRREADALSRRALVERTSLLGGRQGSTQAGTLLGG